MRRSSYPLLLLLASGCLAQGVTYRFEPGQTFRYLVAQESRPAQGPQNVLGQLTYDFEVIEAAEGKARLAVTIAGTGRRGPDANSQYPQARAGVDRTYEGLTARFTLTPQGAPTKAGAKRAELDAATLALEPGGEYAEGSGEWAMVQNVASFFPWLGAQGTGGEVVTVAAGPDLFAQFPNDVPELTGLLWTREPMLLRTKASPPEAIGEREYVRVDFQAGFAKTTTHRGVNFKGTYRMNGFALIDPEAGRPVAYKVDPATSGYKITVTGGGFLAKRVASSRLRAANDGFTPVSVEVVDAAHHANLAEYLKLKLVPAPAAEAEPDDVQAAAPEEGSGILGM